MKWWTRLFNPEALVMAAVAGTETGISKASIAAQTGIGSGRLSTVLAKLETKGKLRTDGDHPRRRLYFLSGMWKLHAEEKSKTRRRAF